MSILTITCPPFTNLPPKRASTLPVGKICPAAFSGSIQSRVNRTAPTRLSALKPLQSHSTDVMLRGSDAPSAPLILNSLSLPIGNTWSCGRYNRTSLPKPLRVMHTWAPKETKPLTTSRFGNLIFTTKSMDAESLRMLTLVIPIIILVPEISLSMPMGKETVEPDVKRLISLPPASNPASIASAEVSSMPNNLPKPETCSLMGIAVSTMGRIVPAIICREELI